MHLKFYFCYIEKKSQIRKKILDELQPYDYRTNLNNSIKLMMDCGMHLGHKISKLHPSMSKFVLGERFGLHIIDLDKSLICIRQACSVITEISRKMGKILFVGTQPNLQRITYDTALYCDQFYVNKRWIGGTLTNNSNVLNNSQLRPDLIVLFDPKQNFVAVKEAYKVGIPVIAICDTDVNSTVITYPIPSNDESVPGIEFIAKIFSLAAKKGLERRNT